MRAELKDGKIVIFDSYNHRNTIKEICDRVWDADNKTWEIPFAADNLEILLMLGCSLDDGLKQEYGEMQKQTKEIKEHIPIEPMPIKAKPYSHQVEGFNLACEAMKIFNN